MATMAPARKKRISERKEADAAPPRKRVLAAFKGSEEFGAWLDALIKHERIPVSSLIEKSLIIYAKHVGFEPEAPER